MDKSLWKNAFLCFLFPFCIYSKIDDNGNNKQYRTKTDDLFIFEINFDKNIYEYNR